LKDANNNITTLNKDNEKNKIKLEEGDSKRIALENEKCDLKKQLQNSRDQLKRAQSDEVAIT
jgi:predicted  nucleic acid-binding Zn-ribbon protein